MIQIKIVSNMVRKTIATNENNTIRDVLEANDIDYAATPVYIDGAPLQIGDHDKTFKDMGITEKCSLQAVAKIENA